MYVKKLTLWSLLKEPRFISALHAIAYSIVFAIGIIFVFATPGDLVSRNGVALGFIIGGLFIVSGVLGTYSLHGGEWWMERAGVIFLIGGLLGYIMAIWTFDGQMAEKTVRTLLSIVLILLFSIRYYRIRGLVLDPTK